MNNIDIPQTVEVVIHSRNSELIAEVIRELSPLEVEQWPTARMVDPVTVLAVVGGAVTLANKLLELRDRLVARGNTTTIRVTTASGRSTSLDELTVEVLADGREEELPVSEDPKMGPEG